MISTSPSWPASPCSTAFVTSSVSARASGVAYSLGSVPKRPVERVRARVFGAAATSATSLSTRSNTSSKSTVCARPSDSVSCTTAIADDPPHRLRESLAGLVGVRAARLDAQQRRDRLQVVLDAVVDLADRRVLGDELLLLVADLGDVAAQHDRADPVAVIAQRDRPQRHGDAARLDVGAPRRAPGHDDAAATRRTAACAGRMRVVTSIERLPLELVVEAHPVERRQRVGAREGRDAVDVEPDEAVRCARRAAARRGRRRQVGEVAGGDHPEQVVGAVVEGDLLP